jgi:predicted enzyme related to lactoylglutathione lyase
MPTIVHFDVPAEDVERAKKFYSELFDWKIERMPGPMEYYGITTTDEDGKEAVGGGMAKKEEQNDSITNYIGVPSIDEYIIKVEQLDGKIIMSKTPIPGFGYLAVCLDTENNKFGLWESDEKAQ